MVQAYGSAAALRTDRELVAPVLSVQAAAGNPNRDTRRSRL
jgi:hypothetical protein